MEPFFGLPNNSIIIIVLLLFVSGMDLWNIYVILNSEIINKYFMIYFQINRNINWTIGKKIKIHFIYFLFFRLRLKCEMSENK